MILILIFSECSLILLWVISDSSLSALIALWPIKMKINCSRKVCTERMDEHTLSSVSWAKNNMSQLGDFAEGFNPWCYALLYIHSNYNFWLKYNWGLETWLISNTFNKCSLSATLYSVFSNANALKLFCHRFQVK